MERFMGRNKGMGLKSEIASSFLLAMTEFAASVAARHCEGEARSNPETFAGGIASSFLLAMTGFSASVTARHCEGEARSNLKVFSNRIASSFLLAMT